ncbi:MAG: polyprenyl diphosphate synthase [Bdellovibrionales bacterium]|nr:polyprenyl diphosphate synthase [Bdellovibrionales bacterium]
MNTLRHLAIIMDGNGRWATGRNRPRSFGHVTGANVASDIIRYSSQIGIPTLSLFAFSKENWRRPASEVNMLMRLLAKSLTDQLPLFRIHKIRLNVIGDRDQIPRIVSEEINRVELATLDHCGMKLVVAVNYSGQFDIIQAVRRLSQEKESLADITFQDIQSALLTGASENPDLIIRTGGDTRLSNFYLWQAANSEIHFEEKLWPDFTRSDLDRHLCQFAITERRFGRTGAQLKDVK